MPEAMAEKITRALDQVACFYNRLVLVVAPSGTGKTAALQELAALRGHSYVNANL